MAYFQPIANKGDNMKRLAISIGGKYILVPEGMPVKYAVMLMEQDVYYKWYGEPWKIDDSKVELQIIDDSELPLPENQPVIDMQDILAENNRLTREVDLLKAKLAKLETDTNLVVL